MPSRAKQIRRMPGFLSDSLLGLVDRLMDLGGPMRDTTVDSCCEYLEYLENLDIDGIEPVESPPLGSPQQKMLFDEPS